MRNHWMTRDQDNAARYRDVIRAVKRRDDLRAAAVEDLRSSEKPPLRDGKGRIVSDLSELKRWKDAGAFMCMSPWGGIRDKGKFALEVARHGLAIHRRRA
jgi:hypothetical protein